MVTAFLSAFAATLIVGVLARFAAIIFTSERTARVAAFAIALGFALGRYSYSGPASVTVALALTACIGAVAALVILWAWLLRKAGGAVSSANG